MSTTHRVAADTAELRSRARTALACLPAEDRAIISLAWFQKLTLRQIAERAGISVMTVQRRTTEALRRLKVALEDE